MQLLTIVAILFAAASVMFALQNNVPVTVTFLIWSIDGSLAMLLLITLALGGLIVALISTPSTVRRQWTISRLEKRVDELEQTCSKQKGKIAELEHRPLEVEPAVQEQPAYIGLKQLIAGGPEGEKQE